MSLYASIDEVMDCFNFEQVHKVMVFLDWKWANYDLGFNEVPDTDDMKATALQCLHTAIQEYEKAGKPLTGMNVATGGFEARVDVFASGTVSLKLAFEVESAHTY